MIHKKMVIIDIVQQYPETMEVFFEYGIQCVGCSNAMHETLEEGAQLHGFDVDELLDDLLSVVGSDNSV